MAEMSNTVVGLRIFGKEVNPEDITKKMKCLPTYSASTGQELTSKNGKKRIVKEGFWRLEYSGTDNQTLEEKIKAILNMITNDMNIWKEITSDFRVDVFCGLFMDTSNEGFIISADLSKELAIRGLIVSYDIYSSGKDSRLDYQIENDPEYLAIIDRARKDIRSGKGISIKK